jgi:hypothetical protein
MSSSKILDSAIGKHPSFIQEHYLMWNPCIHVSRIAPGKPNMTGSNMGQFKKLQHEKQSETSVQGTNI